VKNRLFFILAVCIFISLLGVSSWAFDIQYPDESGFFIGIPMTYMITAEDDENFGQEGIFVFGQDLITIAGIEYYDSVFDSPSGTSHFYFGIDPIKGDLTQKGITLGETEIDLDPAITAIDYPLSPGDSWAEETDLTATELEIPGLGKLPFPVLVEGLEAETRVSSMSIAVPAGEFDTLLVESTYTGSILGIPVTLVQRTWLSESNITVKRNFEFSKPTQLSFYDIELSKLPASSVSYSSQIATTWANIKIGN